MFFNVSKFNKIFPRKLTRLKNLLKTNNSSPFIGLKLLQKPLINTKLLTEIIRESLESMQNMPEKTVSIVEEYSIDEYTHVLIARKGVELLYVVVEPPLEEWMKEAIAQIYIADPTCRDVYCLQETIYKFKDQEILVNFSRSPIGIIYHYMKLVSGYGPLYPLIKDPFIEEIAGSSNDRRIMIIHRKYSWYGWMKTNIIVDQKYIDRLVLSLARKIGKHLSIAQPIAEGLTPEGLRLSLTYGREISRKGSSFVIRKKPSKPWTITMLIEQGTITSLIAAYLWLVLELRGSIIIVGGMSTGKTTLLQALLTIIPPTRRVVTIEDTPEICGSTGIWDPLVERVTSIDDSLNIDMYTLLKLSLRRRADYIVVGEVRGKEARLLVQASRLGHGVLATMHGEDAEAAIERLIAPPISIPKNLLSSIWTIVVMDADKGGRRVRSIYEVDDKIRLHKIIECNGNLCSPHSAKELAEKSIRLNRLLDTETISHELASRTAFLQKLANRRVFDINVLSEELLSYYQVLEEEEVVKE